MKINKASPSHWIPLLGFFAQGIVGLALRTLRSSTLSGPVVLYGHKLNGNLLALYRHLQDNPALGLKPVFLTIDAAYHRELLARGVDSQYAASFRCSKLLADATAVITSHGLHTLQPLCGLYRTLGLRFFDVWHGIPYKGFDANDFRVQHKYDEVWVASTLHRELYVGRFGFAAERVVATGYPRTDQLVNPDRDIHALRAALDLPSAGKLVLFAPTWAQDAAGRSLFPFGCSERECLGAMAEIAGRHGGNVVLRTHLNSGGIDVADYPNVHALPASRYPDAEAALLACDALVCDWSSIAFDFLVLDRPAIFLDVEPPFRKGFSLGPEYRYGTVVDSLEAMIVALDQVLAQPDTYWKANAARHRGIKQAVYGGLADGKASERCVQRLVRSFAKS